MEVLAKYFRSDDVKDMTNDELEEVFSYMIDDIGKIKNELNRRIKNGITKEEISRYIEDVAFGLPDNR